MDSFRKISFAAAAFGLAANFVSAEENSDAGTAAEEEKVYTTADSALGWKSHLITPFYAHYAQTLPSSVSDGGKIAKSVYGTGLSWRFIPEDKTRISLSSLDYRRTDFRFSGAANRYSRVFRHTDSFSAMTYQEFINPHTGLSLAGYAALAAAAEDRVGIEEGIGGFIGVGAKQYFSETTSVTLGAAAAYSAARERWYVLPLVSFDWEIAEHLSIRMLNGLTLTWNVNGGRELTVDFSASYSSDSFVIERDGNAESRYFGKSGAVICESIPVGISGTWNLSENFYLNLGVTANFRTKYKLYRSGRKTGEDFRADTPIELSARFGIRF